MIALCFSKNSIEGAFQSWLFSLFLTIASKLPMKTSTSKIVFHSWIAIAALVVTDGILMAATGLAMSVSSVIYSLYFCALCWTAAFIYRRVEVTKKNGKWDLSFLSVKRPARHGILFIHLFTQIIVFFYALTLFSCLSNWFAYPLINARLIASDSFLSLDSIKYTAFVNNFPLAAHILEFAYYSLVQQITIIMALLFFSGRYFHLHSFVIEFMISASFIIVIALFFPSLPTLTYANISYLHYQNINVTWLPDVIKHINGFRTNIFSTIPVILLGLVTFPSFHACFGVIAIKAALYFKWPLLRFVFVVNNLLLIIATRTFGAHYFVDVFAGILVAWGVMALSRIIVKPIKDGP